MEQKGRGRNHEVNSRLGYVNEVLSKQSDGDIHCLESEDEGLHVVATENIGVLPSKPTKILTCTAAAIALDTPFRQTHCSFCACTGTTLYALEGCQMVAACTSCGPRLMMEGYHRSQEFTVLKKMETTFGPSIDAIFVLTARLLCCQNKDWWKLFCCLHEHESAAEQMQQNIDLICSHLPEPANDAILFRETLGRVLGCSHNITDFSRPLGNQSLGRAIFMEHSFYNHSCTPNAYLSCHVRSGVESKIAGAEGITPLTAEVHLLNAVKNGEDITISYIPMSGLSNQERKKALQEGYGFDCKCSACTASEPAISLSETMDVQSVREIQFSCNERLLTESKAGSKPLVEERPIQASEGEASKSHEYIDEVEQVISLVQMTQRGIRNQGIPETHEVSIESHRLLALAYTLVEDWPRAKDHHEIFVELARKISCLFDPVAFGIQMLEYATVLKRIGPMEIGLSSEKRQEGITLLQRALGNSNPWVSSLLSEELPSRDATKDKVDNPNIDATTDDDAIPREKRRKVEREP